MSTEHEHEFRISPQVKVPLPDGEHTFLLLQLCACGARGGWPDKNYEIVLERGGHLAASTMKAEWEKLAAAISPPIKIDWNQPLKGGDHDQKIL